MIALRKPQHVASWIKFILGFFIGVILASYLKTFITYGGGPLCSYQENMEKKVTQNWRPTESTPQYKPTTPATATNEPRKLIFVGVMTAQKYLDSRALAIHQTWGPTLPGKLMFFSSESSQTNKNLPLVTLKGVDDSYPPQKKSFLMLKYIHDNFLDDYEWFMRADDDVYVRTEKLETFLRSINSSKTQFIGQAGVGNKEEFGQLSLDVGDNFCMGGPGIIFSRQTLKLMVPHIRYCLKHLYTTHEDVEVGRCVRKFASVSCTWSYEMQTIFYHNFSGEVATSNQLRTKEIHRAITLHPIKQPKNMHRLHRYFQGIKSQELRTKALQLHRELLQAANALKEDPDDWLRSYNDLFNTNKLGVKPDINNFRPNTSEQIIAWDFFAKSHYSIKNRNPKIRLQSAFREGLDDTIMEVMDTINKFSKQRGRIIEFKDIYYGYYRVNPYFGVDFILDMLLTYKKFRGKKMTVPVRRHAYLRRAFTATEICALPNNYTIALGVGNNRNVNSPAKLRSQKEIHFIVPLYGRLETFSRFMTNFENICLMRKEAVKLAVVLFLDSQQEQDSAKQAKVLIDSLRNRHAGYALKLIEASGTFSRALALEIGAKLFPANALLFFIDVDMVFDAGVLDRIRKNTIMGKSSYFPIVFSQYDPNYLQESFKLPENPFTINKNVGYWRQFGFGIASLYNSDLQAVGGMDTTIQGWGKEDVDLYSKLVTSEIEVFRAPDPGLIHVFHPIICDPNLTPSQYEMCLGSKASSMGTANHLAELLLKQYKDYF